MKRGCTENPKFRRLVRRLGWPEWQVVGLLESVWLFTGKFARPGNIGRWTDADIADGIGYRGEDWDQVLSALIQERWLDRCRVHRLLVHDYPEHADGAVVRALKREDARRRGVAEREGVPQFARPGIPLVDARSEPCPDSGATEADPPGSGPGPDPGSTPPPARDRAGDDELSRAPEEEEDGSHLVAAVRCRERLVARLLERSPRHRVTNRTDFDPWDRTLERLLRLDGRREGEILAVIDWSVRHEFWGGVIQGPDSLRKHWDKLDGQRRRELPDPTTPAKVRSFVETAAENPSDRRELGEGGELVDPEADVDHAAAFRASRARYPSLRSRSRRSS